MADEKNDSTKIPSLADYHYFLFAKEFDQNSCAEAMTFIIERNLIVDEEKRPDAIRMIINSEGGETTSAFALIDIMEASKVPIYTYGFGQILSAGLLTFMAGEYGHRYITKNTSILSHQYSWSTFGKEHELFATVKEMDLTKRRIMEHYKKYTGQTEATIKKYLLPPEDVWLSAKEAVKFGLADKIIDGL